MPKSYDSSNTRFIAVSSPKQVMKQINQEEIVIRTDEVETSAVATRHRARPRAGVAGRPVLASVAARSGGVVPTLGAAPAGATGGAVTTITGHAGATRLLSASSARGVGPDQPTYVARASNGDLAVAQTKAGSVFVYLIPAASEANVFNIQTAPAPSPAFGPLTGGDAYIVAGTGTAGSLPSRGTTNSTTPPRRWPRRTRSSRRRSPSTRREPPHRRRERGRFGHSGGRQDDRHLLRRLDGRRATSTPSPIRLSGAPSTSILMGDVAAASNGLSVDPSGNIVVG